MRFPRKICLASQYVADFMLKNLSSIDPDKEMEKILWRCIRLVNAEAHKRKDRADWFSLQIDSQLLDRPIYQNLHKLSEETIKSVLRKFALVDMSNRNKDRPPLIEEVITIDITAVSIAALKKHQQKPTHPGKGRRRFQLNIPHKDPNCLIAVINSDKFCLFRAVNLVRAKTMLSRSGFSQYYRDPDSQNRDLRRMKEGIHLPDQEAYAIEDFG